MSTLSAYILFLTIIKMGFSAKRYPVPIPCRPSHPVQVAFVMDGKSPFYIKPDADGDGFQGPSQVTPFYHALTDSPDFIGVLKGPHKTFTLGAASFLNWGKGVLGCYEFKTQLGDWQVFRQKGLPTNILPDIDPQEWDSTLNAVLYAALDGGMGWDYSNKKAKKLIIFISNKKWKHKEDNNPNKGEEYGKPPPPTSRNKNRDCTFGPVSASVLFDTLDAEDFYVIGLLTGNIYEEYKGFFKSKNWAMLKLNEKGKELGAAEALGVVKEIQAKVRAWFCTCQLKYEFAVAVDTTWTFVETFAGKNIIPPLKRLFKELPDTLSKMSNENPGSLFHLTTFGDYPTVQNGNLDSYCYRYQETTSNSTTFLQAIQNVGRSYGGRDELESSLTALLYTATDPSLSWSSGSSPVLKVIAIGTDKYFKSADDGGPGPEYKYPRAGECCDCGFGPPSVAHVASVLKREDFHVVPVIDVDGATKETVKKWESVFQTNFDKWWMPRLVGVFPKDFWYKVDEWAEEVCGGFG